MADVVRIDGSYGEGGGQIIRTSVSLAALTGRAVEITNVRARRSKPGLQPQHLTAVRAAADVCAALIDGAEVGATQFTLTPASEPLAGRYRFDIGTAGATPLVSQTLLIPLAHAQGRSEVTLIGGTHVPHAPTAEYIEAVYAPTLRRAGAEVAFRYEDAGFYPRGGGRAEIEIAGSPALRPLDLVERGKLRALRAYIVTSSLPSHVGERGAAAVTQYLKGVGRQAEIEIRDRPSRGPGAAVILIAECEGGIGGFTGIGERGKPMERVAEEACDAFMAWWKSGAACDEYLADQLVLPMSLAPGESRWTTPAITEHLRTVLWVAGQFLPIDYTLGEARGGPAQVTLRRLD